MFPVVADTWAADQEAALIDIEEQPLKLSGDGICDSPDHCAKFGTYYLMDQKTDAMLDFQIVQVS